MATAVPVFRNQYLDATVTNISSEAIKLMGNRVNALLLITNIATGTLTIKIQGSYDGKSWVDAATGTGQTTFGASTTTASTADYAFVRGYASLSAGKALFDLTFAFADM